MSGDESSQIQIGRNTYVFLGRWLHVFPGSCKNIKLDNYSGLFGIITTALSQLFPTIDEIRIRHLLIAFTGFIAILYAGKTARFLYGNMAAIATIWMLFLSPRFFGASMNDSKDIPFAMGMIISTYYLLRLALMETAEVKPRLFAGLGMGLFLALGIRINGMVFCGIYSLMAYVYLIFRFRKSSTGLLLRSGVWFIGTGLVAFAAAIFFLPNVWSNIPLMTLRALHTFSTYKVAITMLFMGTDIPTEAAPWQYLPVWVGITTPIIVLALFLYGSISSLFQRNFGMIFLFFTVIFPWISIVIAHSPVYDAWRQFYFIYPPMVVLGGVTAAILIEKSRNGFLRMAMVTCLILCMMPGFVWSLRNHPLENVYFNELIGGVDGAYGHFETDYYGEATELACRKLLHQPVFNQSGHDSVFVLDNIPNQVIHYIKAYDPKVSLRHNAYESRDSMHWDFGIFYTRGLDSLLKRKDWPPAGIIDSVMADHTMIMAIVKNPKSQ